MVQYKPALEPKEYRSCRSNTYWMLENPVGWTGERIQEHLKRLGWRCRYNAGKAASLHSFGRYKRGLLCYEMYNIGSLRSFCQSRGLSTKARTRRSLVRKLEEADDQSISPRFFELPSEIRNVIYEYHFGGYRTLSYKHHQPPLTLASSQLRSESLLLFYKCVTFKWTVHSTVSRRESLKDFTGLSRELLRMPAACLSRIKSFTLLWETRDLYGNGYCTEFKLKYHEKKGKQMSILFPRSPDDPELEIMRDAIGSAIREIGCSGNDWKLQHGHLDMFCQAVKKAWEGWDP